MRRTSFWLAAAALVMHQGAWAQSCWPQAAREAAQVKQFDIMLMVSMLRCHGQGTDLSADYNRFVIAKRPILKGVGSEIIREFNRSMGGKAALEAYDKLGVVMANRFGNGADGMDCQDIRAMIADANAAHADRESLVTLAQHAGMDPPLPMVRCDVPVQTATAVSATPAPAVTAASLTPAVAPSASAPPVGQGATQSMAASGASTH